MIEEQSAKGGECARDEPGHAPAFAPILLLRLGVCVLLGGVGIVARLLGMDPGAVPAMLLFGGAVVGAAFLLAWAAEALQVDINKGMAMAILAFIAVLPEYAVDLYFAWTAARDKTYAQYAAANMTGSNRLLIGIGWSVVVLCGTCAVRRRFVMSGKPLMKGGPHEGVDLEFGHSVDLLALSVATVWALLMPLSGRMEVWHGAGLLLVFVLYVFRISGVSQHEPELAGVASAIGHLPRRRRRALVGALLIFSGAVLLFAAEPFAESLIATGEEFGIDKFLLVQWLAPLASEAPELLVATIFALNGKAENGLSALLSSKVNQWTLLVGTLPIVYSLGKGEVAALPLDTRQVEEFILTTAQGLLGVAFLLNRRLHRYEAVALLVLFLVQIPLSQPAVRNGISALYFMLAFVLFIRHHRYLPGHLKVVFLGRTDGGS